MTHFPANDVHLRIDPLRSDQIDQAFASLELTGQAMSLAAWRRYALEHIHADPAEADLLSIQCDRAYHYGLLGYDIATFGTERHMMVDLFRTADYLGEKIASSLVARAEAIAREQGCAAIHIDLPDFKGASIIALKPRSLAILCQNDYAIESIQVSKTLLPQA